VPLPAVIKYPNVSHTAPKTAPYNNPKYHPKINTGNELKEIAKTTLGMYIDMYPNTIRNANKIAIINKVLVEVRILMG
jgi:hypothetical protein